MGYGLIGMGVTSALTTTANYLNMREEQKFAAEQQDEYFQGLQDLFDRRMGVFESPNIAGDILEQLYTGGSGRDLIDFMTRRIPLTKAEKASGRWFNRQAAPLVQEGIADLQSLKPYAADLMRTGWPTDLDAIINAEQRRFRRDTVPGIYEGRFPMLGEGSGLESLLNTAGVDLGTELGALAYARDEAATARRVAGFPIAQAVYEAPAQFGMAGFGEIGRQGELFRIRRESTRPGAAPPVPSTLDWFSPLASAEQGQVFPVGPQATGQGAGGTGYAAAALMGANLLSSPYVQRGIMDLYNRYGGGNTYWQGGDFDMGTYDPYSSSIYSNPNMFSGVSDYGTSPSYLGGTGWGATGDYSLTGISNI